MIFAPGDTSKSLDVVVVDDAGLPVTGLLAATFPVVKYSLAGPNADAVIALADLATFATAWTSGGVKERGEGVYRLDLPNAAIATAGSVRVRGEATNKRVICEAITVAYVPSNQIQLGGSTQSATDLKDLADTGYNPVTHKVSSVASVDALSAEGVDALWDELLAGHGTAGSAGAFLSAAGAASDPLLNLVPGSYASGTAGHSLGRIGTGRIMTVSPVSQGGDVEIVRGDSYTSALGRALSWTDASAAWPTLTDALVTFELDDGGTSIDGTVVVATGSSKSVKVEPTVTETSAIAPGVYDFAVVATYLGTGTSDREDRVTLVRGKATVVDREDA